MQLSGTGAGMQLLQKIRATSSQRARTDPPYSLPAIDAA
jgi:hypothetical protein